MSSSKWRQAVSDGSLYRLAGGDPEQGVDSSVHCDLWTGGHDNKLNTAPKIMGTGWEDVVHDQARE